MTTSKSSRRSTRRTTTPREAGPTHLLDADERDELWPAAGLNDDRELKRGLDALVPVRALHVEDEFGL